MHYIRPFLACDEIVSLVFGQAFARGPGFPLICPRRRAAGEPGRARSDAGVAVAKTGNALSRSEPLFPGYLSPSYDLCQQIDTDFLAVVGIGKHEHEIAFIHMLVLSSRYWPNESQFSQTSDQLLSGYRSQSRQLLPSPVMEFQLSGR